MITTHRPTIPRWLSELTRAIVVALVASWMAWSGLFGYGEATEQAARDVVYRGLASDYPVERSPKTSVVLLGDDDLGEGGFWPAPYAKHAALLEALARHKPRAIFIDIGFIDNRPDPTIEYFAATLKMIAAQGVRVYLAGANPETGARQLIRADLRQLAEDVGINLVSIQLGSKSGEAHLYPLLPDSSGLRPAALALYADQCGDNCIAQRLDREFELWWPASTSSPNCERVTPIDGQSCPAVSSPGILRLMRLAVNWIRPDTLDEADPIHVPHLPTYSWTEIVEAKLSDADRDRLSGATVFYGLNLALIRDDITTPTHGTPEARKLPGVYYHATAFDNLVALGDQRIDPSPPLGLSSFFHMAGLILICCLPIYAFQRMKILTPEQWVREGLLYAFVALSLSLFEFWFFKTSPANWIGVLVSIFAAKAITEAVGWHDWFWRFWGYEVRKREPLQ